MKEILVGGSPLLVEVADLEVEGGGEAGYEFTSRDETRGENQDRDLADRIEGLASGSHAPAWEQGPTLQRPVFHDVETYKAASSH